MVLWSLLSVFTAAAAPSWSVVVTRTIGLDAESGRQLSESLSYAMDGMRSTALGKLVAPRPFNVDLKSRGVEPAVCAASVECAARLGEVGGVRWLVSLSLARVGGKLVVDATLIDVKGKTAVTQLMQSMPYADPQAGLVALGRQLVDHVPDLPPEPEPAPAAVAPVAAAPASPPEPRVEAAPEAPSRSRIVVPLLMGAAALVAGGLGVHFALQATGASRQVSMLSMTPMSTFGPEQQQLDRWGRDAQTYATVSFALAGVAVLAMAVALILM